MATGPHTLAVWAEGHGETSGEGVGAAEVRVVRAGAGARAARALDFATWSPGAWDGLDERGALKTMPLGWFDVGGLSDEVVDVLVVQHGAVLALREGVRPDAGELELTAERAFTHLDLHLVDAATGETVYGGWSAWTLEGEPLSSHQTRIAAPPGRFALVVGSHEHARTRVEVEATPGRTLALGPVPLRRGGGSLDVAVELPPRPIARVDLRLVHPVGQVRVEHTVHEVGLTAPAWRTPLLEPGRVSLRVRVTDPHGGVVERTVSAQVVEGATTPVTVRVD